MGSILVALSSLGFSTLGIFGKLAFDAGFTRNQTLFWRFLFTLPFFSLVLIGFKAWPDFSLKEKRKAYFKAFLLGFFGIGLEASLYFMTLHEVGAALAGILLYLYPAFVALISDVVLKRKLNFTEWFCVGLSLVGCAFAVDAFHLGSAPMKVSILGFIYGILTALWYAIYLLIGAKVSERQNPMTQSAWITTGSLFAFAFLSAIEVIQGVSFRFPQQTSEWGALLGIAVFATVLPFSTLYVGMSRIGTTLTAVISTLEIVFTIILAMVFLGEKLTFAQLSGAFLILLSVLLIQKARQ